MIQELEQQLKDRPVLWAFLKPLLECLVVADLVEERKVGEDKMLHAYRDWRNRLVLFDDVDINTMIEREVDGQKMESQSLIILEITELI
jgi:hypothetical protein